MVIAPFVHCDSRKGLCYTGTSVRHMLMLWTFRWQRQHHIEGLRIFLSAVTAL